MFHHVEANEDMHSISQEEGIKLKSLYKKNRMLWGQEPKIGEVICLQKKCALPPKLKTDEEIKQDMKEEIQERVDDAVKENQQKEETMVKEETTEQNEVKKEDTVAAEVADEGETIAEEIEVKEEAVTTTKTTEVKKPKYHSVQPQETLYRIATQYGITVEELKKLNGMASNSLTIGQMLLVGYTTEIVTEEVIEKPVIEKEPEVKKEDNKASTEKTPKYHTVGPQETFYKIATKYGLSVEELKRINELTSNSLTIGQKLIVGYIADENVQKTIDIEENMQEPDDTPTTQQQKTSTNPTYHKVQQGETIFSIAQKYNLNIERLKQLNNLSSTEIKPGQVLKLR